VSALQPHQERVLEEFAQLTERIGKLSQFLGTAVYRELSVIDRELLSEQLSAMSAYQRVLRMRLSVWGIQP
jgi:hypothetical protein